MSETELLQDMLVDDGWRDLQHIGDIKLGWETVDKTAMPLGRDVANWWSFERLMVITEAPSGTHYAWQIEEGIREQDSDWHISVDILGKAIRQIKTVTVQRVHWDIDHGE